MNTKTTKTLKVFRSALLGIRLFIFAVALLGALGSQTTYAATEAPASQEQALFVAGDALADKLQEFADDLTLIGRPLAALALVVVFLLWIAEPLMPEVARENKGKIQKVAFGAILLGIVPDVVSFLFE